MKIPTLKILLAANYINIFGFSTFSPLYALFVLDLGLTPSIVGYSWAAFFGTAGLLTLFTGRFENKYSNKKIFVVVGYAVHSLAIIGFMLTSNLVHLLLSLVVYAAGVAIYIPSLRYLYAKSEDKGEETEEWAIFDGGNMIFIAAGSAVGGFVIATFGFDGILWIMFITHIISVLIASLLLRNN